MNQSGERLRILTYNIRSCINRRGQASPDTILAAIEPLQPDVVALQEVDVGIPRTRYQHQLRLLAEGLVSGFWFLVSGLVSGLGVKSTIDLFYPNCYARAMSRPLRIDYTHAWHHVMNRARRGADLFTEKIDYQQFVDLLQETADFFNVNVAAFYLMPNHYHLMVQKFIAVRKTSQQRLYFKGPKIELAVQLFCLADAHRAYRH